MLLLLVFAFVAGIMTILSPCIVPVLPLVLSSSVGTGKARPFGVVLGFIGSFTTFTLFLTALVRSTGLPPDTLRTLAIGVLLFLGLGLLVPQLQTFLELILSRLSSLVPQPKSTQGFWGGMLVGFTLGLVWTPCVGPILASVIALALTGTVTVEAFLITLAYSLGTAVPLFFLVLSGQKLLNRVPRFAHSAHILQRVFGVIMILTALALAKNLDRQLQARLLEVFPQYGAGLTAFEDVPAVREQLQKLTKEPMALFASDPKAPEIIAGGEWFNSEPLQLADLRGKVVLIDFWTYTCINCIRTLPYIQSWHEKYKDQGLVIIGVHTPEFEFEKNPENVSKAIKDFGLTYPVVQDNEFATWRAYNNHYWPAKYFIDREGVIRHQHFGEGEYDESEKMIQDLLKETGATISEKPNNPKYQVRTRTPETYLGFHRMEYVVSPEKVVPNQTKRYSAPLNLPSSSFAFGGEWTVGAEYSLAGKGASLLQSFEAQGVYLVMRPQSEKARVRVLLDGKPVSDEAAGADVHDGYVTVDSDRLYRLIEMIEPGEHVLQLQFEEGNVEVFAFTFG